MHRMLLKLVTVKFAYLIISSALYTNEPDVNINKKQLKEQALEMFRHAYRSYMKHAYPADELMPLSCRGRIRGKTPSRGDVDDALGNFSLTLIDALDTLVVLGEYGEFEDGVRKVLQDVSFDQDIIVSVFETNIRVVGGLLGAHFMASLLKNDEQVIPRRMQWYTGQLIDKAIDIADRLLPACNTTSGLPRPRVNLRHGMTKQLLEQHETCTACAGTMILEFATLSTLSGNPKYERAARKAMDFLWSQRHHTSDLMGTVLNVVSGNWVRRDAGIGAGIDSYYEYLFKAYILLGDSAFLHRFNLHYDAIMTHLSRGPVFVDVHMHKPSQAARGFMDALSAFWPGLQVLKGDLKPAIETHEMLYQVVQKHEFLPEAFTHDFQVHWGQHPLRPEFIESTYFLYRATKDPHYLQVAEKVMRSINQHARKRCGFAGVLDVRAMSHEDRMDSFLLAETFKYLYMIFTEPEDLLFDPEDYIFTTEAHPIPLNLLAKHSRSDLDPTIERQRRDRARKWATIKREPAHATRDDHSCPNMRHIFSTDTKVFARQLRSALKGYVDDTMASRGKNKDSCHADNAAQKLKTPPKATGLNMPSFLPIDFNPEDQDQLAELARMGIEIQKFPDGRIHLVQTPNKAESNAEMDAGLYFLEKMIELTTQNANGAADDKDFSRRIVQILSPPSFGYISFAASPALFGPKQIQSQMSSLSMAKPLSACSPLTNRHEVYRSIVLVQRGQCMFETKTRHAQAAGAIAVIVLDNTSEGDIHAVSPFAMSGDQKQPDSAILTVFLHAKQSTDFLAHARILPHTYVHVGSDTINPAIIIRSLFSGRFGYASLPYCELEHSFGGPREIFTVLLSDGRQCLWGDDDVVMTCFYADGHSEVMPRTINANGEPLTKPSVEPKDVDDDDLL